MKKEKWEKGKEKERNSPTSERREADTTLTPRRTYLLAAHVAAAHRLAHVKDPGKFTVQPALGRPPDSRTGLPEVEKKWEKEGGGRTIPTVCTVSTAPQTGGCACPRAPEPSGAQLPYEYQACSAPRCLPRGPYPYNPLRSLPVLPTPRTLVGVRVGELHGRSARQTGKDAAAFQRAVPAG